MSLYDELGGAEAISGALDAFYVKVFADPRVRPYFEEVDMTKLKAHVGAFFAMAFGGPNNYDGRDLRTAHERPRAMGLNEKTTDVFLRHFQDVLEDFGVDQARITTVMDIANGARPDVLAH
jgi:hemoglobin